MRYAVPPSAVGIPQQLVDGYAVGRRLIDPI
jgi:hypothetical protein